MFSFSNTCAAWAVSRFKSRPYTEIENHTCLVVLCAHGRVRVRQPSNFLGLLFRLLRGRRIQCGDEAFECAHFCHADHVGSHATTSAYVERSLRIVRSRCLTLFICLGRCNYHLFDLETYLAHRDLSVPVTAKIRALEKDEDTLDLVKRLEGAGAQLLTGTTDASDMSNNYSRSNSLFRKSVCRHLDVVGILTYRSSSDWL